MANSDILTIEQLRGKARNGSSKARFLVVELSAKIAKMNYVDRAFDVYDSRQTDNVNRHLDRCRVSRNSWYENESKNYSCETCAGLVKAYSRGCIHVKAVRLALGMKSTPKPKYEPIIFGEFKEPLVLELDFEAFKTDLKEFLSKLSPSNSATFEKMVGQMQNDNRVWIEGEDRGFGLNVKVIFS